MAIRPNRPPVPRLDALPAPALVLALATAAALACGCAYYNTFYAARKHYKEAERQYLAGGQGHPAPGVLELYQRSIEGSQKVIAKYSKSKWVDDARYLIGMAYLRREEWDKAYATFEELIAKHPGSSLIPDARLGMGLSLLGRGNAEEAEKTFETLLADHQRFERRGEVLFHLARSHLKRREHRRGIRGLTELLAADAEDQVEADALEARGEAYLAVEAPDSALADFRSLVPLRSRPEDRLEAELRVGECLERLGRLDAALSQYARLEREMPGPSHLPRTLLARARALGDLGKHQEALAVYERITREFPVSNYAAQAQYQIGLTQELHLNQVEAAKEAYAKVRQSAGGSEFATLAQERQRSLDLFGQYREEMAKSGGEEEKKAQAGFLLAELSLFRLRKVDEALVQYQAVERDYPRSALAPKAAYAVGWIYEHERGDSAAAVASYRQVFDRYPDTEYGVEAGVKAGVLSADSLSIHLGHVFRMRATADSLLAVARLEAAADSLGVGVVAAADSLAAAALADSLAAAADSLAAARSLAAADSLRADSLLRPPFDMYSTVPPEERRFKPDSSDSLRGRHGLPRER